MNISLASFKKIFTGARGGSKTGRQFLRDPRFDWRAALICFLALNIASAAFHLFFFTRAGNEEIFRAEKLETAPKRTLNRFELEKTAARFEEQRARFEELVNKPLSIPDPYVPAVTPKKQ